MTVHEKRIPKEKRIFTRRRGGMMRIAQIAPPWIAVPPKNYGGTEAVLYNLVEEQVAQGHEVTLYTPESSQTSAQQISFFPKALLEEGTPWTAHLKAYYHLLRAVDDIKEKSYDFVHAHLSASTDLLLLPLTARLAIPHVVTLHSHFPFDHVPGGWSGDADRYYMDWASDVPMVAISEHARKQELQSLPRLNFVGIAYNGISMKQYQPSGKARQSFFMWLGRFNPEKGPHLAIEAAKKANVPLVLAGTIDRSSKELVNYYNEQIKPQADGENIRLLGPVNLRQKISYLSRARGFLNPIEWEEPFGMVMIEAMALGCPVISFNRGAASEVIADGKSGFLVHNVDEMVERMGHIDELDHEAIREHVEQHFSARTMARKYTEIYQKVIAMSKQRASSERMSDVMGAHS
jgi:glycosyltransferase involved in cell wall biosynthesis